MIYRAQTSENLISREMDEINRRRDRMAERTTRVLDSKRRQIGLDLPGLDSQVRDRRAMEQLEKDRNDFYDNQSNDFAQTLIQHENQRQRDIRQRHSELNDFRKQQEREKNHKEKVAAAQADNLYDMNTNLLKFAGEDREFAVRTKAQQRMQENWLAQQVQMLRDKDAFEQQEEVNYEAQQAAINDMRQNAELEAAYQRRQRNLDQVAYNKLQAREKKKKEEHYNQEEQTLNSWEIKNTMTSKIMNEGVGPMDGPSNFKGFTPAQRQQVLDTQAFQMAQMNQKRDEERAADAAYDTYQEQIRQAIVSVDEARSMAKQTALQTLKRERQVQKKETKQKYEYLDNVVYQNPVKESYFQQWQQGSR